MLICVGDREKRSSSLFIHSLEWIWKKICFFFSHKFLSQLREYVGYIVFLDLMFLSGWFFCLSSCSTNFLFLLLYCFCSSSLWYFSMIFFWPFGVVYDVRYVYLHRVETEALRIFYIPIPSSGNLFFLWLFSSDYPAIPRAEIFRFWSLPLTVYYFRHLLFR